MKVSVTLAASPPHSYTRLGLDDLVPEVVAEETRRRRRLPVPRHHRRGQVRLDVAELIGGCVQRPEHQTLGDPQEVVQREVCVDPGRTDGRVDGGVDGGAWTGP